MTGFGEANYSSDTLTLTVEIRAVNNRHLKVVVRGSDPYHLLEPEFEKLVRRSMRRGSVQIYVHAIRPRTTSNYRIDVLTLQTYVRQIREMLEGDTTPGLEAMMIAQAMHLPGVTHEPHVVDRSHDHDWPIVEAKTLEALNCVQQMRQQEGVAMARELQQHQATMRAALVVIGEELPRIAEHYRSRLMERVRIALAGTNVAIEPKDLIREVAIYSDRGDIAEEVMRLGSHLDQFDQVMEHEVDSPGKKLEFIAQEILREVNTIGSKANDIAISRQVVEIKSTLEKVRELLPNVE